MIWIKAELPRGRTLYGSVVALPAQHNTLCTAERREFFCTHLSQKQPTAEQQCVRYIQSCQRTPERAAQWKTTKNLKISISRAKARRSLFSWNCCPADAPQHRALWSSLSPLKDYALFGYHLCFLPRADQESCFQAQSPWRSSDCTGMHKMAHVTPLKIVRRVSRAASAPRASC